MVAVAMYMSATVTLAGVGYKECLFDKHTASSATGALHLLETEDGRREDTRAAHPLYKSKCQKPRAYTIMNNYIHNHKK